MWKCSYIKSVLMRETFKFMKTISLLLKMVVIFSVAATKVYTPNLIFNDENHDDQNREIYQWPEGTIKVTNTEVLCKKTG